MDAPVKSGVPIRDRVLIQTRRRAPSLEEVKEIQRRLNERGFKTDGIDGRTGSGTVKAILAFQKKVGMEPADGYAGLKVLARLRQGS